MNSTERVFFRFEDDFVEAKIRCIPMIVRFKLDACGVKLKLSEWSRMTYEQREHLACAPCGSPADLIRYREYLFSLIVHQGGDAPTLIPVAESPAWSRTDEIPFTVLEKLAEMSCIVSVEQWRELTDLQRFALQKLSYSGHENKNFPRALAEFGLMRDSLTSHRGN